MSRSYNILPSHEEMAEIAQEFLDLGISVIPLANPVEIGSKRPAIYWRNGKQKSVEGKIRGDVPALLKDYALEECKSEDVEQLVALGHFRYGFAGVMGIGDILVLDYDHVQDWTLLKDVLRWLNLPEDYRWVVITGSGEGFQIWVRCYRTDQDFIAYDMPTKAGGGIPGVYSADACDKTRFHHAEIRHKEHYSSLPPSLHPTGNLYKFKGEWPEEEPDLVPLVDVLNAFQFYTVELEETKATLSSAYESEKPLKECYRIQKHPYVAGMLNNMCEQLAKKEKPGRGNLLFAQCCKIFPFANNGHINKELVIEHLTEACQRNGLPDNEIQYQINRANMKTFNLRNDPPRSADSNVEGALDMLISSVDKKKEQAQPKEENTQEVTQENPPDNKEISDALLGALRSDNKDAIFDHVEEISTFDEEKMAHFERIIGDKCGRTSMRSLHKLIELERRKKDKIKKKPVIKSAYDLMNMKFEKKSWIVPDILPPGLIALAGKQKIGKSWLDLGLCLSVASGTKAFGSIQVEEGDVLYLALEDNEIRLQDRLSQLLSPGEVMPKRFNYVTEWPRMDADGIEALEEWIKSQANPKLIIIDPWVKVKPRVKSRQGETGYDSDYEALEGVKRLADQYQVCVLVQFHLRKAGATDYFDELNGTSGITACADGLLHISRGRAEADGVLKGTGRDYAKDVDLALRFSNGMWNILGSAQAYSISKESKEIIDILNQEGRPLAPKDIAKLLHKPGDVVRQRLVAMRNRGEVKDTGSGYVSLLPDSGNNINADYPHTPHTPHSPHGAHTPHSADDLQDREGECEHREGLVEEPLTALNSLQEPDDDSAVRTVRGVRANSNCEGDSPSTTEMKGDQPLPGSNNKKIPNRVPKNFLAFGE